MTRASRMPSVSRLSLGRVLQVERRVRAMLERAPEYRQRATKFFDVIDEWRQLRLFTLPIDRRYDIEGIGGDSGLQWPLQSKSNQRNASAHANRSVEVCAAQHVRLRRPQRQLKIYTSVRPRKTAVASTACKMIPEKSTM